MKLKTSVTFDAKKLAKWLQSDNYRVLKGRATLSPMASAYKKFIREGKVKPKLSSKTIDARRKRTKRASLGGTKPLYDTGRLAQSIRYDEKDKAIKAIYYAKHHIDGFNFNGVQVPSRDFIQQTEESFKKTGFEKTQMKGMSQLREAIKRVFSRRLAK